MEANMMPSSPDEAAQTLETADNEQLSSILGRLLLEDNYSIESLLEQARKKNLNLRELRDLLIQYQQELQQTSLELFNSSYDRFFKLSHLIACLAEPIKHVIQPIQNYRNQLGHLCKCHDQYLADIDKRLAALEDTSKNKLLAERLIALVKRRDRIFQQINRLEWLKYQSVDLIFAQTHQDSTTNSVTFRVNCDSIERVYIELHYLLCEVAAIQPTSDELMPIKKTLEATACEQQRRLGEWFANMFFQAIQAQDKMVSCFILDTYEQRGDFRELDQVWRQQVVRPYLNIIFESDTKLVSQLQKNYTLLRQFLDKHTNLIEQAFVTRSFWAEVTEAFDRLRQLYTSDDIRTFKERYEMTQAFLREQPAGQDAEVNTSRILSKFDLQSYFNQKSTEIRTSIEATFMQQPLSELPESNNKLFQLKVCSQIYQLIAKCWSNEIYIDGLDDNFTRLVCRVLEKFADWLSRLSLSDFRIVGTSHGQLDRSTNFLARQDAIMRILIEDCTKLVAQIEHLEASMPTPDEEGPSPRRAALVQSLNVVTTGLDNVRNLQKLLER